MEAKEKNSSTRSVDRALAILDCFADQEEMILLEIAERTGLSSSTCLRILSTLQAHQYVVKDPQSKVYRLGQQIRILSEHTEEINYNELKAASKPCMEELNRQYNEDVRLFVPAGRSKLCILGVDSDRELRQVIKVGTRHDIVRGATGKVICAHMIERELQKLENSSGVNMNREELCDVLRNGYALSRGEREEGLFGIAVPIYDPRGKLQAIMSMSGPSVRFDNQGLQDKIDSMRQMGKKITELCRESTNGSR